MLVICAPNSTSLVVKVSKATTEPGPWISSKAFLKNSAKPLG